MEGIAVDLAGRIGWKELVPAPTPDVVECGTGIRPPQRHARVRPQEVVAARLVNEVEDLRPRLGEERDAHPLALEQEAGHAPVLIGVVDDPPGTHSPLNAPDTSPRTKKRWPNT